MARIDALGAETLSLNEVNAVHDEATGGTHAFEIVTNMSRSGSASFHAIQNNFSTAGAEAGDITLPSLTTMTFSFSLRVANLGASSFRVPVLQGRLTGVGAGANDFIDLHINQGSSDFSLRGRLTSGIADLFTDPFTNLSYDKWYRVALRMTISGTDTVTVTVDGDTKTASSSIVGGSLSTISFGLPQGASEDTEVWIDDIIIDNTDTDIPQNTFLSFHKPTSDKTTGWSTVGSGATHAARVSDNSDSTAIRATGSSALTDEINATRQSANIVYPRPKNVYGSIRVGNAADTVGCTFTLRDSNGTQL